MKSVLPHRHLGSLEVSAVGLGCMPISWGYDVAAADPDESRAMLHRAVELGVTLFDTADAYGPFTNEEAVGQYLMAEGFRDQIKIATKVGLMPIDKVSYSKNGKPSYIRKACDDSLSRLQLDYIDLYQLHRIDPEVPVEESWGAMAELVEAGKVRNLGLSEVTVEEIKRAQAVHPVSSVQSELSIWTSENLDNGVVQHCNENNIGFLAFSPLGRGFLTGAVTAADIKDDDFRSNNPRFTAEAIASNQAIVDGIANVAKRHNATNAQVSLAWVMAQGPNVVPIPGTKRRKWLEQNVESVHVLLTEQDLADIAALPKPTAPRY
jgi:aryl-alcohol dehydrogenase-like predicted oxidoreductase